jgi:hypothetical protein
MKVVHLNLARISLTIEPSPSAREKKRGFRYKNLKFLYKLLNVKSKDDVPPAPSLMISFSKAMPYDPSMKA